MHKKFSSVDEAFMVISDPNNPCWLEAFTFLSEQPETAQLMLKTFSDTLTEMGIEPSGIDEETGEAIYSIDDVAKAMGVSKEDMAAAHETDKHSNRENSD